MRKKINSGFSILEVLIAIALLAIIASGSVVAVVGSFSSIRLGKEKSLANLLAYEGIEAATSIRNQNWSNLTNGDHGLIKVSSVWTFSSTLDTYNNKFNRVVAVNDVYRDTNGSIIDSGGTLDPDTKKVISTVNWYFTSARQNQVTVTKYLTNWQFSKNQSLTPMPPITTCSDYCLVYAYTSGTCRTNVTQCTNNGEINEPSADAYCVGTNDTCCCRI